MIRPTAPATSCRPAAPASGKLYITNFENFDISVFDTAHGNAALPVITLAPFEQPAGAAVDASGKLYVAIPSADRVIVFDTAHDNAPLPAIAGGLGYPFALAIH
jgi:DNA-binding beta-propeller fold protein YncE